MRVKAIDSQSEILGDVRSFWAGDESVMTGN